MYHYYDVVRLKFLTIKSAFIVNFPIAHAATFSVWYLLARLLSANLTKVA
jgi:hypothetical protein